VHRDYAVTAPVQIRVYEDRLVIWNPAVFPEGWSQQTLVGRHVSHPYNPDISNTFFRAGEIEAWGRGIERIFAACRKAGTPKPRLRFDAGGIWTEFAFGPDYLESLKNPVSAAAETLGKTPDRILDLLKNKPDLTVPEMAAPLGKSESAVNRALQRLQTLGQLRRAGSRKSGHWEINL